MLMFLSVDPLTEVLCCMMSNILLERLLMKSMISLSRSKQLFRGPSAGSQNLIAWSSSLSCFVCQKCITFSGIKGPNLKVTGQLFVQGLEKIFSISFPDRLPLSSIPMTQDRYDQILISSPSIFLHPCTCCMVPQIASVTMYIPRFQIKQDFAHSNCFVDLQVDLWTQNLKQSLSFPLFMFFLLL